MKPSPHKQTPHGRGKLSWRRRESLHMLTFSPVVSLNEANEQSLRRSEFKFFPVPTLTRNILYLQINLRPPCPAEHPITQPNTWRRRLSDAT